MSVATPQELVAPQETSAPARRAERPSGRTEPLTTVQVVGDLLVAFGAVAFAYVLRFLVLYVPVVDAEPPEFSRYLLYCISGAVLYVIVAGNGGLYDSGLVKTRMSGLDGIVRTSIVWFFTFLGLSLFIQTDPPISRLFVFLSFFAMIVGQGAWRFVFLRIQGIFFAGERGRQRILIVGSGTAALAIARRLDKAHDGLFSFVGFVATDHEAGGARPAPGPVVGRIDELESLFDRDCPDQVIVADGQLTQAEVMRVARVCERRFIGFFLAASSFEIFTSCLELRSIAGVPVMGVAELPANRPFNRFVKRLVDIAGGGVGLLFSLPVMAVLAVLIKRESPGPVFYRQTRIGQNGRLFTILKMRSMRMDAEAATGARWAVADDPRRTRIGEFMRKTNLDEIPQFWNVLKGDMSLVGPRPERPEFMPKFLNEIPYYQSRHSVKPGITGWAQVNGLRGNTDLSERIRFDLQYIENWSLWWDFAIAARTFIATRNAY